MAKKDVEINYSGRSVPGANVLVERGNPKFPFRTGFGDTVDVGLDCSVEPSLTKQEFKDDCDINRIVARFIQSGGTVLDSVNNLQAVYGDFSNIPDFTAMQAFVADAYSAFYQLPAELRYKFKNDPQKLIDFVNDPVNEAKAVELGLLAKPEQPPAEQAKGPVGPVAAPADAGAPAGSPGKAA